MKEKFNIEIAGLPLTIVSDEEKEHIEAVASVLDERVRDLTVRNKRCSKVDAALLCALDYCSEAKKLEEQIHNLEAQIALYEANLKRYRDENTELKGMINELEAKPAKESISDEEMINELDGLDDSAESANDAEEAPTPESYKNPDEEATPEAPVNPDRKRRADQLKQIESLLRASNDEK